MELKDRKRSIDIDKLSAKDAEAISQQIGDKVREICDEAAEKANKILNIYGMKAQMQIAIKGINEELKKVETKQKGKRGRSKKDANL